MHKVRILDIQMPASSLLRGTPMGNHASVKAIANVVKTMPAEYPSGLTQGLSTCTGRSFVLLRLRLLRRGNEGQDVWESPLDAASQPASGTCPPAQSQSLAGAAGLACVLRDLPALGQ